MKNFWMTKVGVVAVVCLASWGAAAQQSAGAIATPASGAILPRLVGYSGVLKDTSGRTVTEVVGLTFLIYKDETGGAPLWLETQSIKPDETGRYTVQLGAASTHGLPSEIFITGEARWLAVQPSGEAEQPRVLLVAVPYAIKAVDAETVGGLPASAFVLAASPGVSQSGTAADTTGSALPPASTVTTSGGTVNQLPLWTTGTNVQSSVITQTGSGTTAKVGIGTATPAVTLDVKGAATIRGALTLQSTGTSMATSGDNSEPLSFVASSFSSSTSAAVNQKFQWQAEPVANNTASPSGTLNLLYGAGTAAPAETGIRIDDKGILTFATGQTFPGTGSGTVTGVGLSAPSSDFTVTGSPVTHNGTLNFAWIVPPTSGATPNAIVKRDGSGNFAVGAITGGASAFSASNSTQVLSVTQAGSGAAIIASSATNNGIVGQTTGVGHQSGVMGIGGASGTFSIGVQGQALSTTGTGVVGLSTGSSGIGVSGKTTGTGGIGVTAAATSTTGVTQALFARAFSPSGIAGVFDNAGAGQILSLRNSGVEKVAVQNNGIVQVGTSSADGMLNVAATVSPLSGLSVLGFNAPGGSFLSGSDGAHMTGGFGDPTSGDSSQNGGVGLVVTGGRSGQYASVGGAGVVATGGDPLTVDAGGGDGIVANGGPGIGGGTGGTFTGGAGRYDDGDGVDATNPNGPGFGFAGNFQGDINVTGSVITGTAVSRIDDPLDPANKYLLHTSVESSEMKNIYDGMITLDANGEAQVTLPSWFEAVNGDFRYQLTAIGRSSPGLYIAREISENRFQIAGGMPGTKVSWQVTGVRKDAYAKANPLVVEQVKSAHEQGYYIHPELYGAPDEKGIEWARNPRWMQHVKALKRANQVPVTSSRVAPKLPAHESSGVMQ